MASCPTASTILLGCSSTLQRKEEEKGQKKKEWEGWGGEERRDKMERSKRKRVKRKEKQAETHIMNFLKISLVPRPSASFPSLAVKLSILQGTESWVRAWEQGYLKITHFINIP